MKLLLISLLFAYAFAQQAVIGGAARVQVSQLGATDVIRALQVNVFPLPPLIPRVLEVRAAQVTINGNVSARIDACRFVVNTLSECAIYFQYFAAAASLPAPGVPNPISEAAAVTFAVVIKKFAIFEYLDLDGTPGYQFGTADNITGIYQLGHANLSWKPPVYNVTVIVGVNRNVTVHAVVWETSDEVYYMRYFLSDFPVMINGIRITPNAAKIDIGVRWFDNPKHIPAIYTTGPSAHPTARVGILAVVGGFVAAAGIQVQHTNTSTSGSLGISARGFAAAFNYVRQANATQKGIAVAGVADVRAHVIDVTANGNFSAQAAAFQGWTVKLVAFSFEGISRPQEVFWDPTIGGNPDPNAATSAPTDGQTTTVTPTASLTGSSQTHGAGAAQMSVAFFALIALVALLF